MEATNKELEEFSEHAAIVMADRAWFIDSSRSGIRKNITLLQRSKVLDSLDSNKVKKGAKKFNLLISMIKAESFQGKKVTLGIFLIYLNEQYYEGMITGNKYRTNSKRM